MSNNRANAVDWLLIANTPILIRARNRYSDSDSGVGIVHLCSQSNMPIKGHVCEDKLLTFGIILVTDCEI